MKLHKITINFLVITLLITVSYLIGNNDVFAWSSNGGNNATTNTHYWIMDSAKDIIKQNKEGNINPKEIQLLEDWEDYIGKGTSLADYRPLLNADFTYASHFDDPATGKSFIPFVENAKNMSIHYFQKAGNTYTAGHSLRAFYYLGLSLHYISDLTQPMHAANFTNLSIKAPLYHSKFETFAVSRHPFCKVKDGVGYWDWKGKDPGDWIQATAVDGKQDFPNIYNNEIVSWVWRSLYNPAYTRRWEDTAIPVIDRRLTEAQRIVAGYIHLWFETYVLNTN